MYAVIQTGGKQYRVEEGQRLEVERLGDADDGRPSPRSSSSTATPCSPPPPSSPAPRSPPGSSASAKGPKITGFTYKNKSNQRRRWGHRQHYATIEITGITKG